MLLPLVATTATTRATTLGEAKCAGEKQGMEFTVFHILLFIEGSGKERGLPTAAATAYGTGRID
jgi:hypothetical protein